MDSSLWRVLNRVSMELPLRPCPCGDSSQSCWYLSFPLRFSPFQLLCDLYSFYSTAATLFHLTRQTAALHPPRSISHLQFSLYIYSTHFDLTCTTFSHLNFTIQHESLTLWSCFHPAFKFIPWITPWIYCFSTCCYCTLCSGWLIENIAFFFFLPFALHFAV